MALPIPNPIDTKIFERGVALDHLGSTTIHCRVCESDQGAEGYRVLVSGGFGFGAPYFIKPFLKRSSTKGKFGKRAIFAQCCKCTSLWAEDEHARDFSVEMGWGPHGWIAD